MKKIFNNKSIKNTMHKLISACPKKWWWKNKIVIFGILVAAITSLSHITAGRFSLTRVGAPHLVNPMSVRAGVSNYGFAAKVGGIAFGEIAQSLDGSVIEALRYNSGRADGSRLEAQVRLSNETFNIVLPVYDWEFIPVARFAKGNQDALITYFGELTDKRQEERYRERDCRIVNYHSAIDNTLIGLRLMQSDLLAFHEIGPLNLLQNGNPIKATNENLRDEQQNRNSIAEIQNIYSRSGANSYIICDVGQRIGFRVTGSGSNRGLELSGHPYWSCWTTDKIDEEEILMELLIDFVETLSSNEQIEFLKFLEGSGEMPHSIRIKFEKFAEKHIENKMSSSFKRLPQESNALSEKMRQLEGGNPPVYRSLCNFMRYAALFRYFKNRNPGSYNSFVDSFQNVNPNPQIITPTVICSN